MGEFDRIFRCGLVHERIINSAAGNHCPHWDGTVGDLLRDVHQVWSDSEVIGTGDGAHPAESSDNFVKDQQYVVLVADFTQSLQISLRWH